MTLKEYRNKLYKEWKALRELQFTEDLSFEKTKEMQEREDEAYKKWKLIVKKEELENEKRKNIRESC